MEREAGIAVCAPGGCQAIKANSHSEQDQVRQLRWLGDRHLARCTISGGVQQESGALHLRVLSEVHELGLRRMAA
jgi:hypothetical protein